MRGTYRQVIAAAMVAAGLFADSAGLAQQATPPPASTPAPVASPDMTTMMNIMNMMTAMSQMIALCNHMMQAALPQTNPPATMPTPGKSG